MSEQTIPTHAISVKQPWAEMLLMEKNGESVKSHEFRSWRLSARYVGKPLALHATKGVSDQLGWAAREYRIREYGYGVIGIILFDRPVAFSEFHGEIGLQRKYISGDWDWLANVPGCPQGTPSYNRWWYAWPVTQRTRVRPVACKGARSIWPLPDEVRQALAKELAR